MLRERSGREKQKGVQDNLHHLPCVEVKTDWAGAALLLGLIHTLG